MAAENEVGFQALFEEVVKAKRLSGSKVQKLQNIALKNMENDTQMVSIMFRTHKSLSPNSKISSLYVFDALARAARDAIDKKKVSADLTSATGNCATFLSKLEGILESFVQDLIGTGSSEVKEKTKKVLDIWIKHRTFPAPLLERLLGTVSGVSEQDVARNTKPSSGGVGVPQSSTPPGSPPGAQIQTQAKPSSETVADVQNALLALLSQAASTSQITNSAFPASNGTQDTNQIALLQALAQAAQVPGTNGAAQSNSVTPPQTQPQDHRRGSRDERDYGRYNSRDAGSSRGGQSWRGRGGFRAPGQRDSPPPRHRRSRSRSPGPYSHTRRDPRSSGRPFSPPSRREQYQNGKDEFGRDMRPISPGSDQQSSQANGTDPRRNAFQQNPSQSSQPQPSSQPRPAESQSQSQSSPPTSVPPASGTGNGSTGLSSIDMSKFDFSSPESWQKLGTAWEQTHGHMPNQDQLMAYVMSGGTIQLPAGATSGAARTGISMGSGTGSSGRDAGAGASQHTGQQIQVYQSDVQDRAQSSSNRGRGRGGFNNRGRGVNVGYSKNEDRQMNSWEEKGYQEGYGYNYDYSGSVVGQGKGFGGSDAVVLGGGEGQDGGGNGKNGGNGGGGYYGNSIPTYLSDYQDYSQQQQNAGYNQSHNQCQNQSQDGGFDDDNKQQSADNSKSSGGKMQRVGDRWVWQPAGAS